MLDQTKYQSFLNELISLENEIAYLVEQLDQAEEVRHSLEQQVQALRRELDQLRAPIERTQYTEESIAMQSGQIGAMDNAERAKFRQDIQTLLSKIDSYIDNAKE